MRNLPGEAVVYIEIWARDAAAAVLHQEVLREAAAVQAGTGHSGMENT